MKIWKLSSAMMIAIAVIVISLGTVPFSESVSDAEPLDDSAYPTSGTDIGGTLEWKVELVEQGSGYIQTYKQVSGLTSMVFTVTVVTDSPWNEFQGTIEVSSNYTIEPVATDIPNGSYKLTITGAGEMKDYYNNSPTPWSPYSPGITEIVLPEGLTKIGRSAFNGTLIESIDIPATVTEIGTVAFDFCENLKTVNFDDLINLTNIGVNAFEGTALEVVDLSNTKITSTGEASFQYCNNLVSVSLPTCTTTISQASFSGCENLTTLNIPSESELTTIGSSGFWGTGFTELDLSNATSLSSIGGSALQQIENLTKITFPTTDSISIGSHQFVGNTNMAEVDWSSVNSITFNGQRHFGDSGIKSVDLSKMSGTSIPNMMFENCTSIEELNLPETIDNIGSDAFSGCTAEVTITGKYILNLDDSHGTVYYQIFESSTPANLNVINLNGYTFVNWNTQQDGNGTDYASTASFDPSSNITTLYAFWNVNTYTVAFDKNATDATGSMDDMTMTYDQTYTLTPNAYERPGYVFAGWNRSADGSGTSYTDGQEVSNLAEEGTITLYATWSELFEITITGVPDNASLTITGEDGTVIEPSTGYTYSLVSGTYSIQATQPGFEYVVQTMEVAADASVALDGPESIAPFEISITGKTTAVTGETVSLVAAVIDPATESGISYTYQWDGQDAGDENIDVTSSGTYEVTVTATYGELELVSSKSVTVTFEEPDETITEETSVIETTGDSVTVIATKALNTTLQVKFGDGTMTLTGTFSAGTPYKLELRQIDDVPAGYDYGFVVNTPIESIDRIQLVLRIDVPSGQTVEEGLVYRQATESSETTYVGEASFSDGTLSFSTGANSFYWIKASFVDLYPSPVDSDDELPPFPTNVDSGGSNNTTEIVACAAAATVAALMAVFLIIERKRN